MTGKKSKSQLSTKGKRSKGKSKGYKQDAMKIREERKEIANKIHARLSKIKVPDYMDTTYDGVKYDALSRTFYIIFDRPRPLRHPDEYAKDLPDAKILFLESEAIERKFKVVRDEYILEYMDIYNFEIVGNVASDIAETLVVS
jgi:hypothetical protein